MTDDELKNAIDELHTQLHGLVDHQAAPSGAGAGTFNFANFMKNAIAIWTALAPILGPMITGLIAGAGTIPATPDPAIPPKAS